MIPLSMLELLVAFFVLSVVFRVTYKCLEEKHPKIAQIFDDRCRMLDVVVLICMVHFLMGWD